MAKATNKKAAAKKGAAKKVAVKAAPKKAAPKKAAAKKAATKSMPAKKVASKKVAAKSVPPKKAAGKKVASKVAYKAAAKSAPVKVAPKKVAISDETMLNNLYLDSLKDMYYAEKSGVKALPKLAKSSTSEELRQALTQHAEQTNGQVQMLEQLFERLGKKAQGKECEAIEGLIKEADSLVKETKKGSKTRDVAIIMAVQKMEHYEIASYGTMATLSAMMGQTEAKEILGQILQQEKEADALLTQIAESSINVQAQQEGGESEVSGEEGEDEKLDPKAAEDEDTED